MPRKSQKKKKKAEAAATSLPAIASVEDKDKVLLKPRTAISKRRRTPIMSKPAGGVQQIVAAIEKEVEKEINETEKEEKGSSKNKKKNIKNSDKSTATTASSPSQSSSSKKQKGKGKKATTASMGSSSSKKALLIIDVQKDFCPGGSLAVKEGDDIVEGINQLKQLKCWDVVAVSQDWHPKGHHSFSSTHAGEKDRDGNPIKAGIICMYNAGGRDEVFWPDHCIQGSDGAKFHANLVVNKKDEIVQKGTNPKVDSYSAFVDNDKKNLTRLYPLLDKHGITEVFVCGIATDYCVNFTCQDAIERKDGKEGSFKVNLVVDLCRGVDETTSKEAVEKLEKLGVKIIKSADLLKAQ